MRLFKITDLTLLEKITVVAPSREDAANLFIARLALGLGKVPVMEYTVTNWRPKSLPADSMLTHLMEGPRRGFAWKDDKGHWDFTDPFGDNIGLRR